MNKSRSNSNKEIFKDILYGFLRIVILLGMSFAIFSTVFSFRVIHGNNMFPYLMDGDLALLYYRPSDVKNEIVIYNVCIQLEIHVKHLACNKCSL